MTLHKVLKLLNSSKEDYEVGMELAKQDKDLYVKVLEIIVLNVFIADSNLKHLGLENLWSNCYNERRTSEIEALLQLEQIIKSEN